MPLTNGNVFAIMARTKSLAYLLKMYISTQKEEVVILYMGSVFSPSVVRKKCLSSKSCQQLILRLLFSWTRNLLPKNPHQQIFSCLLLIWHAFRTHVFTKNNLLLIWLLRRNGCHSESSSVGLYITKTPKTSTDHFLPGSNACVCCLKGGYR